MCLISSFTGFSIYLAEILLFPAHVFNRQISSGPQCTDVIRNRVISTLLKISLIQSGEGHEPSKYVRPSFQSNTEVTGYTSMRSMYCRGRMELQSSKLIVVR